MTYNSIEHLVLSGGGFLGFSYTGIFKYLEENNIRNNIKTTTGCSMGAIFSLLFTLGYTSDEITILIKNLNLKDFLKINATSIINVFKLKGLDCGKNISELMKLWIKNKTNDENTTFLELYEKSKITLNIGVSNLTTSKFELLNYMNKPHLPIYLAICASVAIPLIYEPISIDNELFCDGALLDNLPIEEVNEIFLQDNIGNILNISNILKTSSNTPSPPSTPISTNSPNSPITLNTNSNTNLDTNNNTEVVQNNSKILAIYITNIKNDIINPSNYKNYSLIEYIGILMHTLTNHYIFTKQNTKALVKNNNEFIVLHIPSTIMTILKVDATEDDIDETITIGYNAIKNKFDNA